jgi:methionyl-tRNA formyltransferase
MKIFLCGQKSFGKAVLSRLLSDGHQVVGVAVPPPVKYYDKLHALAAKERVPVIIHADRLLSTDVPEGTDLIVAAHAHHFISAKTRARARLGAIGFHPSLLPRHRGRDAVRWTVAMRDPVAGATIYWLDEVVDGGPVLSQRFAHVAQGWSYHDLWRELFSLGVDMVSEAVAAVARGGAPSEPQDERFTTWEPSFQAPRLHRPEAPQLPGSESE